MLEYVRIPWRIKSYRLGDYEEYTIRMSSLGVGQGSHAPPACASGPHPLSPTSQARSYGMFFRFLGGQVAECKCYPLFSSAPLSKQITRAQQNWLSKDGCTLFLSFVARTSGLCHSSPMLAQLEGVGGCLGGCTCFVLHSLPGEKRISSKIWESVLVCHHILEYSTIV